MGPYTWERVGDRPTNTFGFAFSPDGHFFADEQGDIMLAFVPAPTGPPAGTWRIVNDSRLRRSRFVLPLSADTLLYGGSNVIYRTTDGGATATPVYGSLFGEARGGPDTPDAMIELPRGHAHAGRILSGSPPIYSDDRGATWTAATIPPGTESSDSRFAVMPSGRILTATTRGVAASDDGGESYGPPTPGLAATDDALATISTLGSVQSGAPNCGLTDPLLCDGAHLFGYSGRTLPGASVWRTNDGGRTWSAPVNLPQPADGPAFDSSAGVADLGPGPDGLGRAVAVLARGIIYATEDGGATWQVIGRLPFDSELEPAAQVAMLMRLGPDGHLWVSRLGGSRISTGALAPGWIYRSAEPALAAFAVAGEAPAPDAPSSLGVSVRPNPVRSRVAVSLTQPARLAVFDALGREVAVVPEASGEVSLDTSGWPAGTYVVRATAGAETVSARLVVAR